MLLLKQQMETLDQVDAPGSNVTRYGRQLEEDLRDAETMVLDLQSQLKVFKAKLAEEKRLSALGTRLLGQLERP